MKNLVCSKRGSSSLCSLGWLIFIAGIIGLFYAFNKDTSVEVGTIPGLPGFVNGMRVNNAGLMNDKQNLIILFGVMSCVGVLLGLFGGKNNNNESINSSDVNKTKVDTAEEKVSNEKDSKVCPQCAELIKIKAIICRFCGYEYDVAELQEAEKKADISQELYEKYMMELVDVPVRQLYQLVTNNEGDDMKIRAAKSIILDKYGVSQYAKHILAKE